MDPGYDSCYGIEKNSYKRDYLVLRQNGASPDKIREYITEAGVDPE